MSVGLIIFLIIFLGYRTPSDAFIKGCGILFIICVIMLIITEIEKQKEIREIEKKGGNKKK